MIPYEAMWPLLKYILIFLPIILIIIIAGSWISVYLPDRTYINSRKKGPTKFAKKLREELIKQGFQAKDLELEKYDGHKTIDLAIVKAKVNIEVDGKQHNINSSEGLKDLKRTFYSLEKGYTTIRIPNSLVEERIKETAKWVGKIIKMRMR